MGAELRLSNLMQAPDVRNAQAHKSKAVHIYFDFEQGGNACGGNEYKYNNRRFTVFDNGLSEALKPCVLFLRALGLCIVKTFGIFAGFNIFTEAHQNRD